MISAPGFDEPALDRYYERSSIILESGERRQYVFGDNISGFFEGYSHSYRRGNGYQIGESSLLADIAGLWNGNLLNRRIQADKALLYPGFIEHHFPQAVETGFLLSGIHAMGMKLSSADGRPGIVSFVPAFKASLSRYRMEIQDGVFLLIPARLRDDQPSVIAVSASVPLQLGSSLELSLGSTAGSAENPAAAERLVRNALNIGPSSPLLAFSSLEEVREAELYISFAYTVEEAVTQALSLREGGFLRHRRAMEELMLASRIEFPDPLLEKALSWSIYSGYSMLTRQYGTGIWAGLPWFRQNWGRDSFIALPGILLATGRFEEARQVLETFSRFQNMDTEDINYGRIPNRVNNPDDIIYNTTDGTPWLLREAEEYIQYSGDLEFARTMTQVAERYLEGALRNYQDEHGLLTHDDADTWMDARINGDLPWSARGDRAVEIQALWHQALLSAANLAEAAGRQDLAAAWRGEASRVREAFLRLFWNGERLADRIDAQGNPDEKVRPNQLMAISVPWLGGEAEAFLPAEIQAAVVRNSMDALLYPYGIASLSADHPYFHPRHDQTGLYHKDAAYHNGTIWGWNAGPALTAMIRLGAGDLASGLYANLADQIINLGTAGSMSELLEAFPDEEGNLVPSGTYSQAWSVSEFTRTSFQDFLGFRPRLMEGRLIHVSPHLPESMLPGGEDLNARLIFGNQESLIFNASRSEGGETRYSITLPEQAVDSIELRFSLHDRNRGWISETYMLSPGETREISCDAQGTPLDGSSWKEDFPAFRELSEGLEFRDWRADRARNFPVLAEQNYLQTIIEAGDFR